MEEGRIPSLVRRGRWRGGAGHHTPVPTPPLCVACAATSSLSASASSSATGVHSSPPTVRPGEGHGGSHHSLVTVLCMPSLCWRGGRGGGQAPLNASETLHQGCPLVVWPWGWKAVGSLRSGVWFLLSPAAASKGKQERASRWPGCVACGPSLPRPHPGLALVGLLGLQGPWDYSPLCLGSESHVRDHMEQRTGEHFRPGRGQGRRSRRPSQRRWHPWRVS